MCYISIISSKKYNIPHVIASTIGIVQGFGIVTNVFHLPGTQSSFINNTGNKSPLVAHSSELNLYNTLFEGNSMTKYVSCVLILLLLRYRCHN